MGSSEWGVGNESLVEAGGRSIGDAMACNWFSEAVLISHDGSSGRSSRWRIAGKRPLRFATADLNASRPKKQNPHANAVDHQSSLLDYG
jgi:hypothetical protein